MGGYQLGSLHESQLFTTAKAEKVWESGRKPVRVRDSLRSKTGGHRPLATGNHLIALTFIRSHVAAHFVFQIGTWHTALIGFQQMAQFIGAATRVAPVNRWAS